MEVVPEKICFVRVDDVLQAKHEAMHSIAFEEIRRATMYLYVMWC